MAAEIAAPRAVVYEAFNVKLGGLPNIYSTIFFTIGIRHPPPIISMEWKLATSSLHSCIPRSTTVLIRLTTWAMTYSKVDRSNDGMLTSMSMRFYTLSGAFWLAESKYLSRSHACNKRNRARLFSITLTLYLVCTSLTMCSNKA